MPHPFLCGCFGTCVPKIFFNYTLFIERKGRARWGNKEGRREGGREGECQCVNHIVHVCAGQRTTLGCQSSVEDQTQVTRLESKHLHPLSHLAGSQTPNLLVSALEFQAYIPMSSQQKLFISCVTLENQLYVSRQNDKEKTGWHRVFNIVPSTYHLLNIGKVGRKRSRDHKYEKRFNGTVLGKWKAGPGEMDQWLRALVALANNLSWIPRT